MRLNFSLYDLKVYDGREEKKMQNKGCVEKIKVLEVSL